MEIGIRELKDNLSKYIRRMEAGERIVITARGRAVAEIVPSIKPDHLQVIDFDQLLGSGAVVPPCEEGDPLEDCPAIHLVPGTATTLIDRERDEA